MQKLTATLLVLLALIVLPFDNLWSQNQLNQKLMMGYQGWFLCQGDNAAPNEWRHWFQSLTDPSVSQLNVDMWPDMSEYTTTYATSMNYPNGTNARLFSSHDASTTNLHFKWMQDYNIYGVYLQRFLGEAVNDARFFQVRNNVLQNVINASAAYGRRFAIMYDISGVADDGNLYNKLITDWEYLVNTYNVTNQTGYVKQENKPVIAIWGIGFRDRGLRPETFEQIINYFHNTAAPQYRAYVVGGVPDSWRTLNNDSESDPRWLNVYRSLDMISPWAVGRYGNLTEADNWKNNKIIPDMNDCNAHGVDYMPVIFPGFSWFNMHDGQRPLNQIPRIGGNFYWRQAYNAISAGAQFIYVAMFDEVDEGTAMFKLAPNNQAAPASAQLVTLDEDGQTLPSDWYLRLANETQRMLNGSAPLTSTIPISPNNNAPVITSAATASGQVGAAFTFSVTASNNPVSYAATGLPPGLSINTTTGVISGTPITPGTYSPSVSATNGSGTGSRLMTITIAPSGDQTPYPSNPWAIPGLIEAENFDNGGQGVSFSDADATNNGGQYRSTAVDIESCSEGGFNIGWTATGEWLEYSVNVTAGTYNIAARVATPNSGRTFHVEVNGVNISGTINVPNTGGWQTWQTVNVTTPALTAGAKVLRIVFDTGDFNINSLNFSSTTSTTQYRIRNRWQNSYLYDGGDRVRYTSTNVGNTYLWTLESVGNGQYEIRNVGTGEYMHIENLNGYIQCTTRTPGWASSRWTLPDASDGFVRIRNAWQPSHYIHVENLAGHAQHGTINMAWTSAQWIFEPLSGGARESTEEILESSVSYWPTPVATQLYVTTDGSYDELRIIDPTGRSHVLESVSNRQQIIVDVSRLNSGVYIVRLTGSRDAYNFRIVKK